MAYANNLDQAIEGFYSAFAGYPLPKFTDPCMHCHSFEEELKVHAQPLRELDLEHLRDYAVDALNVWGDLDVFKHFLPRIFDLVANLPDPSSSLIDTEIQFGKLRHGDLRTWPKAEQNAVESFLHAVWKGVLNDPPLDDSYADVECWICSIGQCEEALGPYLREWIEDERQSAILALSSFLRTSAILREGRTGWNAFWKGREAQYMQLQEWARSSAVIAKLRNAETRFRGSEIAAELALARAICSGPE
jgi:hypothetical protein